MLLLWMKAGAVVPTCWEKHGFQDFSLSFLLLQGFSCSAKAVQEASAHKFFLEDEGNGWEGGGGGVEECEGGERHLV